MNAKAQIILLLTAGVFVSLALCNLYDRRRRALFTGKGRPRGSWDVGRLR